MQNINLDKISELLSKKTATNVKLEKIQPAGSGFHSDGFKLTASDGRMFFLKRIKSCDGGFEFPEKMINSLLVSDGMARKAGLNPMPIGVIVKNGDRHSIAMEINEETQAYHVQQYEAFTDSYLDRFNKKENKWRPDQKDREELEKVVEFAAHLHSIKHPSKDKKTHDAVYVDGIRNVLIHPELTFALLQDYPSDHPFLSPDKQGEYVNLMLQNIYRWKHRSDRLRAIHGDFWGANVFFREDESVGVIDYSRIPWADPGVDIGWWMSPFLWKYHFTGNPYYKELGEEFISMYVKKTGDIEIRNAMSLAMGFIGVVNLYPPFHPNGLDEKVGTSFFAAILKILQTGTFHWDA